MKITFFSFIFSMLFSNFIILTIYLIRKNNHLKNNFSLWTMIILYLLGVFRILLPFDLPKAIVLNDNKFYPNLYNFFNNKYSLGKYVHISILEILIFIFIIGAFICITNYIYNYHKVFNSIKKYSVLCGKREHKLFEDVKSKYSKKFKTSIYIMPNIDIPFGIGVFNKYILLPQNDYNDTELYYILLHKYTHFINKDIPIKIIISIFSCILWWNPVTYLLKTDLEQSLEIKCDFTITKEMDIKDKSEYLFSIVNSLKKISKTKNKYIYALTSLFNINSYIDIKERFDMVINYKSNTNYKKLFNIFILSIFIILTTLSYAFILQPAFEPPLSSTQNSIDFDSYNSYVKQDKEGNYWLCIESQEPIHILYEEAKFYNKTGIKIIME